MQVVKQPTLYSFAIGYGTPLAEFLACYACGAKLYSSPMAGHQTGDVAIGSENWACPKCSASNSGAVYKCGACGYSLV
jgi:DNA-directed RNA polymerase subunit RPC12/RpoP